MSESRKLTWEKDLKSAQGVKFFILFLGKSVPLKENEKRYFISYCKNRNIRQFHAFAIKNDFKNMSESGKLKFETSLKVKKRMQ